MGSGDRHEDDETEIAVPAGKAKFLDASTQLKTAIYDADDDEGTTATASPVSRRDVATEEVPEHVSRVLEKADLLLAGLRSEPRDSDDPTVPIDDPTVPIDEDGAGGSMLDDVTELQKPTRGVAPAIVGPPPAPTDSTAPVRKAPPAEGSIDDSIDISMEASLAPVDPTVLERPNPLGASGDATTQIEAVPAKFDGAPVRPTIRGHGAPLSDMPIGPGPMAPAPAPGAAPPSGDAIRTLSTDEAPQGMPIPQHMQPRPALSSPPRRAGFGGFVDSIKRLFGWRPPPPPPIADDDGFDSGYGAGTYTMANRHVAQRRARDSKPDDPGGNF